MPIILILHKHIHSISKNLKHRGCQHITKSTYTTTTFTNVKIKIHYHTQMCIYCHFIYILSFIRIAFRGHFQKKNHFIWWQKQNVSMFWLKFQSVFSKIWRRFYIYWRRKKFYDDDNMLTDWAKFTIQSLLVYILVTNTQHKRKHI